MTRQSKSKQLGLPAAGFARVPPDGLPDFWDEHIKRQFAMVLAGRRLMLELLAAEYERAEELERTENRGRYPNRREPVSLARQYLQSRGTIGRGKIHNVRLSCREYIHGQEVADWLEHNDWSGASERIDGVFRRMVAEGLVHAPPLKVGEPPPWCSTHGSTSNYSSCHYAAYDPAKCWWELGRSR